MDIFGRAPTLASDSEWLLQSRDANVESLAEVLVSENFQFVYQLALMLTGEHRTARDCALKGLADAIRHTSQYRADTGVRAWLAGFVLQACSRAKKYGFFDQKDELPGDGLDPVIWQVIAGLNQDERLIFILKAFFEFPIYEVAKICHQDISGLEPNLRAIYSRFQTELQPVIPNVTSRQIDEYLKEFANRRWLAPEASDEDFRRTSQEVATLVLKQLSAQKRRSAILAIIGMGLALIIIVITVQSIDTILPPALSTSTSIPLATIPWSPKVYYQVQPGDSLESIARKTGMTPIELSRMNAISSTLDLYEGQELSISVPGIDDLSADMHSSLFTPTIKLLTVDASPPEIRKMMITSSHFWRTLWMDTQEATGGLDPSMTNGIEYIRRQVWIQQPDRSYEISNYLQRFGQMDYYRVIAFKGQGYYAFGSNSHFYWDTDWQLLPGEMLYNPFLDEMVLPGQSSLVALDRQYQVLGQSEVAGRKVLIVDTWRAGDEFQRRIWIDMQTGVILRYQIIFPEQNGQKDFIVTAIAFNIPIPPALFDPRQPKSGGFAMDYSGWAPTPDSLRATDTPAFSLTQPATNP